MYLNKKHFREMIIKHQELSPDVDDTWLEKYKSYPKRKLTDEERLEWEMVKADFISWKKEQYVLKREKLASETLAQTEARLKEYDQVKETLGAMYMKIIDGVLKMIEFNNVKITYDMKCDMKCDAAYIMYKYTNKFDSRRVNPFSFFTEMAKNACRKQKNDSVTFNLKYQPMDHLENMDNDTADMLENYL
jgi:hypothetical protein